MIKGVKMLAPGAYLKVSEAGFDVQQYYRIDYEASHVSANESSYERQKNHLKELVEESVKRRLVSDVPLGTFLSGGIDSSIISGIAKKYKDDLHTFSIGYADEPFFDETKYANLVAKKFQTDHTVFSLSNDDLYEHLFDILDRMDQPFADSSAIPTYILSKKTKEHITVALSGDGADELFTGYNKHSAHLRAMQGSTANSLLKTFGPWLKYLPRSRNGAISNKIRQAEKFGIGLNLSQAERYWRWASILPEAKAINLLNTDSRQKLSMENYQHLKSQYLEPIKSETDFNELLEADMQLVLPNDMLRKVDLMSMAHGLEVRVPFLDHRLVEYALGVNDRIKYPHTPKKLLVEAMEGLLPDEVVNRPKMGFTLPWELWMRNDLRSFCEEHLNALGKREQFNDKEVQALWKGFLRGDKRLSWSRIWPLVVLENWMARHGIN
jgi:asparagine synthase (glutamine-hydrolysing)